MSRERADDPAPATQESETEGKELLGMFDSPAFARRGRDLEYALGRLRQRLEQERSALLDMVHLRLRQWAGLATGPDDWADVFTAPIARLWPLVGPLATVWAVEPAPRRRRRIAARDLVASVERFNRRWTDYLDRLALGRVNDQITQYNRYYVLEKECVLGSARLAARHFVPRPPMTRDSLLDALPTLPVPGLVD